MKCDIEAIYKSKTSYFLVEFIPECERINQKNKKIEQEQTF